jgi:mono/diheme cytochrome c family protein
MTNTNANRKCLAGLMACVFSVSATLVASGPPQGKDDPYARHGRALYVQHCVACHGPSGRGDGPAAQSLKTPPGDLTKLSQKEAGFSIDRVMIWIDGEKASTAHGTREMPVWGREFRRQGGEAGAFGEVYALARYLQSIQKQ